MSQQVNFMKLHDFIWVPLIEATVVAILAITSKNSADPFSLGNSLINRITFLTSEGRSLLSKLGSINKKNDGISRSRALSHIRSKAIFLFNNVVGEAILEYSKSKG